MRAYSLDLRQRVVAAVAADLPVVEAARRCLVSDATGERWARQQRATGDLRLKRKRSPGGGRLRAIPPAAEPELVAQVEAQPDATIAEHRERWNATHRPTVSWSAMQRALARSGWPLKQRASRQPNKIRPLGPPLPKPSPPSTQPTASSSTRPG